MSVVRAADNKDRWLVLVDPASGSVQRTSRTAGFFASSFLTSSFLASSAAGSAAGEAPASGFFEPSASGFFSGSGGVTPST